MFAFLGQSDNRLAYSPWNIAASKTRGCNLALCLLNGRWRTIPPPMTTANKITIIRLLLIPLFVVFGLHYGDGVQHRMPQESLRWAAIAVFVVAAISDGIDGYIARHYNQATKLGAILDAVADKGLLMAGLLMLTFCNWGYRLPWWLAALVITRDSIVVVGSLVLQYLNGNVNVHPRWTGKIATCFQITAVVWAMLQLRFVSAPVALAGVFTFFSWMGYLADGIRQLSLPRRGQLAGGEPVQVLSPLERPQP